ncbi:MAG: penicillin-binding protein 2, partial [Candidatus Melainabacteria bacterium HGW-Melainabacteria-1]
MKPQTASLLYDGLERHQPRLQFRILLLAVVALLVMGTLLGRLFWLQILQRDVYREKALNNRVRSSPLLAPRGNFLDQAGRILATNKEAHAIFFDPRRLSNAQIYQTLQTLSEYLGVPYTELRGRLDFETPRPVYLYHDLGSRELALILEHKERLPGVEISTSLERFYPAREQMAHFMGHMGYLNSEELKTPTYRNYYPGTLVGKNGLERSYEHVLRGADGKEMLEIRAEGEPIRRNQAPIPGNPVRLTIDKALQAHCYELLKRKGVAGSVVVMDVHSGALRALASYPAYDPNLFNRGLSQKQWSELQANRLHPFLDRSTNSYAPGSIFKVVTTLAALGTGHLTPQRNFISRGRFNVGGHIFYDWHRPGFGNVDIYKALAHSIDTVYYELSLEMGIEAIRDYSRKFALGEPTGIDLPDEGRGIVPDQAWKQRYIGQPWQPGDTVNASIGQGYVQMTPLQATRMIAAVANGGQLVVPHLVESLGSEQGAGQLIRPHAFLESRRV